MHISVSIFRICMNSKEKKTFQGLNEFSILTRAAEFVMEKAL